MTSLLRSCFSPPPKRTNNSSRFAQASSLRAPIVQVLGQNAVEFGRCRVEVVEREGRVIEAHEVFHVIFKFRCGEGLFYHYRTVILLELNAGHLYCSFLCSLR